jgi:3-phenylpropionate/trans-cinnamate dioxygenase ferredoxin reductase subunit
MSGEASVVVIGAGLAGASFIAELRGAGYTGDIVLIGDEGRLPYDRPPLSKEYLLTGNEASTALPLPELESCTLVLDDAAAHIDVANKLVVLRSGRQLAYKTLVLATGARAKEAPPLAFPAPVLRLRTLEDAQALRQHLAPGRRLAIIGGGIIGLEVAATARKTGAEVDVIEAAPRLLSRNACEDLASFLQNAHEQRGVKFHFGGFTAVGADGIVLADGGVLRPDVILWATGATPNDELARQAGVECDHGILVNELGQTNVPDIYAIGDVARLRVPGPEGIARQETWTAARDQAKAAAHALLEPGYTPPLSSFYYWTDQYEYNVHVVGTPIGAQNIRQPGKDATSFTVYHLIDGRLTGVTMVNQPRLLAVARRVLRKNPPADTAQLSKPDFDIRTLM